MVNEQVTTVDLTAGTQSTVEFSGAYPYYWIDNKSDSDVYASLGIPEEGTDGTYTIAAGSQLRISGGAFNTKLSLLGNGKVQVIASAIASCPFKPAQGGGGESGYIHPTYTPRTSGLYNISVDNRGHVNGAEKVTKKDITDLGIPGSDTTVSFSDSSPKAGGTASAGTSDEAARGDHVHPLQEDVSGSSGSCTGNAATATKLAAESYCEITLNASDWEANSDGGYICTKTLDDSMPYTNFYIDIALSSEQAAAKSQIEAWNCIISDGNITQTTSSGNTTAFTFYAFTNQPSVDLNIGIQGVS